MFYFSSDMINVYKNKYMNKQKRITKRKKTHHRVINSSTGAVIEDDGIKFEMAIVTGIFVEIVDDEDETGIDDNSVLLTFNESCISLRNCVIFCVKFSLLDSVNVRSIPVIKLSNAVDKIACLA